MSTIDVEATDESRDAFDRARVEFEHNAPFPGTPGIGGVFNTQALLAAWQADRYGIVSDERQALGVIEELTETWMAAGDQENRNSFEDALDGLGDVCVYASQLATSNRLAIGPILDLARIYTKPANIPGGHTPMIGVGMLAQAVLKHGQKIRGMADPDVYRRRLVRAIAMCIAKAIDDVEMCHATSVDARKVFEIVGREVMERSAGHPSIPQTFSRGTAETDAEHREETDEELRTRVKSHLETIQRTTVSNEVHGDPDRFVEELTKTFEKKDRPTE